MLLSAEGRLLSAQPSDEFKPHAHTIQAICGQSAGIVIGISKRKMKESISFLQKSVTN